MAAGSFLGAASATVAARSCKLLKQFFHAHLVNGAGNSVLLFSHLLPARLPRRSSLYLACSHDSESA